MKLRNLKAIVNTPYVKVGIQIYLVVMMSIAFSFLISDSETGVVSAQSIVSTCLENDNGAVCQQYAEEGCGEECSSSACIPSAVEDVQECNPGTCYDPDWGTCSPNSPPQECTDGEFYSDPNANVDVCRRGCCQIGSFVNFMTKRACEKNGEIRTVPVIFDSDKNAAECLGSMFSQVEGACVLFAGAERSCRFTTGAVCAQSEGDFYAGFLCTNPALNNDYVKESGTACFGEDVHWIDDHGNKENLYDDNSDNWNNGRVLTQASCYLSVAPDNEISGRNTCGNCDYALTSTKCGEKTDTELLPDGEYVCRDLSCVDPITNDKRFNGESWCFYQGALEPGLGANDLNRSVVTPGSRHFLMECRDGVVHNSSCGDRRAEVCTQMPFTDSNGVEKSLAKCHPNQAQACINYNTWEDQDEAKINCEDHPECYLKEIDVPSSNVEFEVCVPKYPMIYESSVLNEQICSLASLECKSAKIVRKFKKSTDINKGCRTPAFINQMNDLCMSLGDCGASVNYVGAYTEDGILGTDGSPSEDYLTKVKDLYNEIGGEFIPTTNIDDFPTYDEDEDNFFSSFEDANALEDQNSLSNGGVQALEAISTFIGPMGLTAMIMSDATGYAAWKGGGPGIFYASAAVLITTWLIGSIGDGGYGLSPAEAQFATTAAAVGGALLGGGVYAAGGIVLAVVLVYVLWLGQADLHEYTTNFECNSWSPPIGGADCSKCYDDGFGCSKYACESLGTECEFINEGSSFEECKHNPSDPAPPEISPLNIGNIPTEGYAYIEGSNGYEIRKVGEGDGCIPAYELVLIGLKLNEPGRCTIKLPERAYDSQLALTALEEGEFDLDDFNQEFFGFQVSGPDSLDDFDDGTGVEGSDDFGYRTIELYFGGNSEFLMNHVHPIYVPSINDLGGIEFDPDERMELDLNIFCEDTGGHTTIAPYRIQMCISPQDRTGIPPIPFYHTPRNGKIVNNATEAAIDIYNNVPAKCKWDVDPTLNYSAMQNQMDCNTDPNSNEFIYGIGTGFKCNANVSIPLTENNKTIYIKCEDAYYPGTASENYQISFERTDALEITSITPGGDIVQTFGSSPVTIKVEVRTAGGADNGRATCYYLAGKFFDDLDITGGTTHNKSFNEFSDGDKTVRIKCEDSVGNVVVQDSNFTIFMDVKAPEVTRIFTSGSTLSIVTDELAVCKYDSDRCNFIWENGTDMSIGVSYSHSTAFNSGATYFIRCQDIYGRTPGDCSVAVKPSTYQS